MIGNSPSFQSMIQSLSHEAVIPGKNKVMCELDVKVVETKEKIKSMIGLSFYSLMTDHWTSLCTDNFGALTLHVITPDFKLQTFVLSFEKHKGGCSGEELQQQLYGSIASFLLLLDKLAAVVTDSAANMNCYGDLTIEGS